MVVLDAPETLNAITRETLVALAAAFRALGEDASVRAVVVTGAGRRAFTTGIDLGDAHRVFKMDPTDLANDVVHQMELLGSRRGVPVVGAVNGVAVNAGFEIALACDVLLCSPSAAFVDTHAKLGLLPSWGLASKLPAIVGPGAAAVAAVAGRPISAGDAVRLGPRIASLARKTTTATNEGTRRGARGGEGGGAVVSVAPRAERRALRAEAVKLAREMAGAAGAAARTRLAAALRGMPLAEARAEERRRAFEQYAALPESFFANMREAAGLKPRAKL